MGVEMDQKKTLANATLQFTLNPKSVLTTFCKTKPFKKRRKERARHVGYRCE